MSRIISSPFIIKRLAEHVINGGTRQDLPELKKIFTGGAPVFPSEAAMYVEAFPGTSIRIVYGSTEAEPISSIDAELLKECPVAERGLCVGTPYEGADIRIIEIIRGPFEPKDPAAFEEKVLRDGETGEIVVRGSHVLKSYFNNERAWREAKIPVGDDVWHRTGDSGKLVNGQLYLTGRCRQLIRREGKWLSPFIIEGELLKLPNIGQGTLLEVDSEILLIVELIDKYKGVPEFPEHIRFARLLVLKRIPRDPRHFSKIDYDRLREKALKSNHVP